MLKPAVLYEEQLKAVYSSIAFEEKYKFHNQSNYFDFDISLETNTWNKIQFVSVDQNDKIIGFLSASIDRGDEVVRSLLVINFCEINYVFSKDFYTFLDDLFTKFNFRKVKFSVVVGNPAEEMYDKYIKKYGGSVIGVAKKDVRLQDNKYYDCKLYEIFREDYLKHMYEIMSC